MKLLSWNIQWGVGVDGRLDLARTVGEARRVADFDVLCLQEVASHYPALAGGPQDQPAELAALLPGCELFFGAAVDEWRDGRRRRFGNLVATRLPVHQVRHHPLPWPADAGVRTMQRMCTEVTVAAPFGPLRVMTAHLEYHSARQRMAQAAALRAIHAEACGRAAAPPRPDEDGSPYQAKRHTPHAVLCGDFNSGDAGPAHALLQQPGDGQLLEAWPLAHPDTPRPPTFELHARRYLDAPLSCDFVFVSPSLAPRVKRVHVDALSRASDHQPVLVEFTH